MSQLLCALWDEHLRCDYILSSWHIISAGRLDTIWWCHVLHVITIMDSCLYSWWTICKYIYICISVDLVCFFVFVLFSILDCKAGIYGSMFLPQGEKKYSLYCICDITCQNATIQYLTSANISHINYILKYLQLYL